LLLGWSAAGQSSDLFSGIIAVMSDDDSASYRKQAKECREQAAKAISPLDKEAWLRTAAGWLELAASADGRPRW
jgi:hypothetical protein